MIYSTSINKTLYKRISQKCGNEKCYCQPYNSPLEIVHNITLNQLKKLTCDNTITEITGMSMHYTSLDQTSSILINSNQYYKFIDADNNLHVRLLEHLNMECFFMQLSINYVSAQSPGGNIALIYSEPYCRVGFNTMQYSLIEYDPEFDIALTSFVLTNGCTIPFQLCSGFHFEYLLIPGISAFLLVAWDTNYFDGASIDSVNGGIISATPTIVTVPDINCLPYFKVQPLFTDGVDCNGTYHFTGFEVEGDNIRAVCGNPYRTIVGQVFIKPNSIGTKFAGDTQIVIGQSAVKNIQLTSTNNNNIASWALNEIGAMVSSKGVKIVYSSNPEIDTTQWFILRDNSEIYIQPNQEIEDKFLSVGMKSKDCLNYFTC